MNHEDIQRYDQMYETEQCPNCETLKDVLVHVDRLSNEARAICQDCETCFDPV